MEGEREGGIQVTGGGRRRRKQLVNGFKIIRYGKIKRGSPRSHSVENSLQTSVDLY
jgi:hypothetical protein